MKKEEEIEDSLELCRDIKIYYENSGNKGNNYSSYDSSAKGYPFHEKQYQAVRTQAFSELTKHDSQSYQNTEKKHSVFAEIRSLILCIVLAVILALFINRYVGIYTRVDGISMENTLQDGNYLFIEKLSYLFHDPERFDVIVFPFEEDIYYIKRIIGLPGERIQIYDGDIFINGEILDEDYGKEIIEYAGNAETELVLQDDEYFVLGDNRNHSEDSRFTAVGVIHKEDILGRAYLRVFPFDKIGRIK